MIEENTQLQKLLMILSWRGVESFGDFFLSFERKFLIQDTLDEFGENL